MWYVYTEDAGRPTHTNSDISLQTLKPEMLFPVCIGECLLIRNSHRVPTAQGKRKMAKKNPCQGKHREFGNFAKTQGKHREFCFSQVVNSLMPKVKDVVIFAAKISIFFQKLDRSAKSVLCM